MPALEQKVALVTGAGSGIGEAIAHRLAHERAVVYAADIRFDAAERVADALRSRGATATAVGLDVTDSAAVNEVVDRVVADTGRLDVLVNNAGFGLPQTKGQPERVGAVYQRRASGEPGGSMSIAVNLTDEDFQRIVAVQVFGTFNCTRAALRHMEPAESGAIVNIASVAGLVPYPVAPELGATKAAIIGFTRSVGFEVAGAGVRVNCVAPGVIDTPPLQVVPGARERARLKIGIGRLGRPEEVAAAATWLASSEASYCFGEVLTVSGAWVG